MTFSTGQKKDLKWPKIFSAKKDKILGHFGQKEFLWRKWRKSKEEEEEEEEEEEGEEEEEEEEDLLLLWSINNNNIQNMRYTRPSADLLWFT